MSTEERAAGFSQRPDFTPKPYDQLRSVLDRAANPANDGQLTEDDTLLIAEAWMKVQGCVNDDFRNHFYVAVEDGSYGTRQVIPEEEDYWYAPYRQTFRYMVRVGLEGVLKEYK